MNFEIHPLEFVRGLPKIEDAEFLLSKYNYTPDSLFDDREVFKIKGADLDRKIISHQISALNAQQELAFHSVVKIRGKTYHLPMIDFSTENQIADEIFRRLSNYLPKKILVNMAVYATGRSFHAYSTTLISPKEWIEFMGRLLLVNARDQSPIVDTRWIGHRLIGGFSSLRWSNNSGMYLSAPQRVPFP